MQVGVGEDTKEQQVKYFTERFSKHGDSHLALDWNSKKRQYIAFKALTRDVDVEGKKILDIGCGLGHFFEYLKKQGKHVDYLGIDIVPDMIAHAQKKHRDARFVCGDFLSEDFGELYDMIFISGVFNVKVSDHMKFVENTIQKTWGICKEILSFNMVSNYVDYREPHLYYANPVAIFHFCKKLTRRVALFHDYLPFEFSIIMNKNNFPSGCYSKKYSTRS